MLLKSITRHTFMYYQEFSATMEISTCDILKCKLPAKQIRLAAAWIEIHREELLADWALCQTVKNPFYNRTTKINSYVFCGEMYNP